MKRLAFIKVFSIFVITIFVLNTGFFLDSGNVLAQSEEPPVVEPLPTEKLPLPTEIVTDVPTEEAPTEIPTDVIIATETPTETVVTETPVITETPLFTESPLITETPIVTETAGPVCYPLRFKVLDGDATITAVTPQNCSGGYLAGTMVELSAVVDEGYQIAGWKGTTDDAAKTTINTWIASEAGEVLLLLSQIGINDENIINGVEVDPPGKYPWIVKIVDNSVSQIYFGRYCGGSLVSPSLVVTAAHCMKDRTAADIDIVAGVHNLFDASDSQRRHVSRIVIAPTYNSSTKDSDIALLILENPVNIGGSGSSSVNVIPLIDHDNITDMNATVAGWGDTDPEPGDSHVSVSPVLLEITVPIYSNSVCNNMFHYWGDITDNMFCAGYDTGGSDSCEGDSGGPVVVNDGGYKLTGIVSFGDGCAQLLRPGVYTRIFNFRSFINSYWPLTTAPVPSSPSGTISTLTPRYAWSQVPGAITYRLAVYDNTTGAYVINTSLGSVCGAAGTCEYSHNTALTSGHSYKWKVLASNNAGPTAYSSFLSFLPLAIPTPSSPSGTITTLTPTYTWSKVTGATSYGLAVYDSTTGAYVINTTFTSPTCGTSTCSTTPSITLTNGHSYKWKVRASNATGSSAYSTTITFVPSTISIPSVPTPSSPSGTISTITPTYTWSKVTGATSYGLAVYDNTTGAYVINTSVSSSVCGSSTCSTTPSITLTSGHSMKWKVRASNAAGSSAYSTTLSFLPSTVTAPSVPTPSTPSGTITTLTPTYTWSKVTGATSYGLAVYDSNAGTYVIITSVSSSVCGSSTCSTTPSITLTSGHSMKWKVRATNAAGSSAYSSSKNFIPSAAGGNDDFSSPVTITLSGGQSTYQQDTSSATLASDDPAIPCIGRTGYATVWYRFTAPSTGRIVNLNTESSSYDAVLGVWSGSRGSLSSIASDDDSGTGLMALLTNIPMSAGQTYYIEVAGYSSTSKGPLHVSLTYQ